MTSLPGFTVNVDQNPYLPAGGRDASAIITMTADQAGDAPSDAPGPAGGSAEIIIVDRSLSMALPRTTIVKARPQWPRWT